MSQVVGKRYRRLVRLLPSIQNRLYASWTTTNHKTMEDIPGPPQLPVLGSLLDVLLFKGGPAKCRIDLPFERVRKYGKIYKEGFGADGQAVFLANPVDVESVMRNEGSYPQRVSSPLFEYFWRTYNKKPGVFFLNGVEWYKHRSALGKHLLVQQSLYKYTPEINNIAYELVTTLRKSRLPREHKRSHEVENINVLLFKWAFESVAFLIFGKRFNSMGEGADATIEEFIVATTTMLGNIVPSAYFPTKLFDYFHPNSYRQFAHSYDKMYKLTHYFIESELIHHKDARVTESVTEVGLLQNLLSNKQLTVKEVRCSLIDLMFAGLDTTSNTMQWILYELAKHPDKQEALYKQVRSVIPGYPTAVSVEHLQNLPFLKAVVKEVLRLHPVLNELYRVLPDDLVLSGYKTSAGTKLMIMAYCMGRDRELFHHPEAFLPERWLRANRTTSQFNFHSFSSLPFGFGRRMCLGRRVAELELHTLLVHMVLNFHFSYPENKTLHPIARGTLIPEEPVRVKFKERK